ncbi:hypothetical protein E2L06_20195 [Haloterrigena sp. H1]|uniref:PD-(D/E)XK nuclease family protein n=1 Tax=Haloterrigena sp. H1 TaxID=2552943 RepID=UPI00110D4374|nr:PD-(D/E)XK nuclease family protein [Haloterrigena sp. H1]TMT79135.1 hypothetical protein E2L06_20195 [Haloterrigena sp. H1]
MGSEVADVEPIKVSTLAEFEWDPVDAYIEHLKEINDPRVESKAKESPALEAGEELHGSSFGLLVTPKAEDTGRQILEKMRVERVTAINHGDYQIQGAPDEVVLKGDSVRVEDLKTTNWDDREFWETHQLPPAALQLRIYSWMLSHVPDVSVEDPVVHVKRREDGEAVDWFTHEVNFDYDETEQQIDRVLSLFERPAELWNRRSHAEWKADYWPEYRELGLVEDNQRTLDDF